MKKEKKLLIILIAISSLFLTLYVNVYFFDNPKNTNDIKKYEYYYGNNGCFKKLYLKFNTIFPEKVSKENRIEKFEAVKYTGLLDDSYLGYLVVKYAPNNYLLEKNRLKVINNIDNYNIYGIESFSKELCTLYADSCNGLIYALANDQTFEISYVDIQFHNYICDIDYNEYIDKNDLPCGFDALDGNKTRKKFDIKYNSFFK